MNGSPPSMVYTRVPMSSPWLMMLSTSSSLNSSSWVYLAAKQPTHLRLQRMVGLMRIVVGE